MGRIIFSDGPASCLCEPGYCRFIPGGGDAVAQIPAASIPHWCALLRFSSSVETAIHGLNCLICGGVRLNVFSNLSVNLPAYSVGKFHCAWRQAGTWWLRKLTPPRSGGSTFSIQFY